MRCLIEKITMIDGDPDFPQADVIVEGNHDNIADYTFKMVFKSCIRGNVNHAINIVNLFTNYPDMHIHLKLDGKDVKRLEVGDYLET